MILRELNSLLNIIQLLNDSAIQIQISQTWGLVHVPCFNIVCIVCSNDGKLSQSLNSVFNNSYCDTMLPYIIFTLKIMLCNLVPNYIQNICLCTHKPLPTIRKLLVAIDHYRIIKILSCVTCSNEHI